MALNDFACVASPVLETNVISPPSYKTSKHSQNISGGHRKTRCPHALRENWSLKCRSVASWSSLPTGRNHQITSNLTVKSPSEEPHSSHRRLYQRYRPISDMLVELRDPRITLSGSNWPWPCACGVLHQ